MRKLARYFPTAIVSGRCRDKVYNFVRLAELYYAGSHGMDIKGPSKGSKDKKVSFFYTCCFINLFNSTSYLIISTKICE